MARYIEFAIKFSDLHNNECEMQRHLSIGINQWERAQGQSNLLNSEYCAEFNNSKKKQEHLDGRYQQVESYLQEQFSDQLHFRKQKNAKNLVFEVIFIYYARAVVPRS